MSMDIEFITEVPGSSIEKKLLFSEFTKFEIRINEFNESNNFLKSLWREFNETIPLGNLERCPWAFMPKKKVADKSVIYFGSMNTKLGIIHVAISFKKKGTIDNICFLFDDNSNVNDFNLGLLKQIVEKSKNKIHEIYTFNAKCILVGKYKNLKGEYVLNNYKSEKYIIYNDQGNLNLVFNGSGYDFIDYENNIYEILQRVINFLCIETNILYEFHSVYIENGNIDFSEYSGKYNDSFQEDIDDDGFVFVDGEFIDFYPLHKDKILLSRKGIKVLDSIIANENKNDNYNIFMNSCHLFKQGIEQEYESPESEIHAAYSKDKVLNVKKLGTGKNQGIISNAITYYMSALENITLIGYEAEKCSACGQLKYEIGNRVNEIIEKYFNPDMGKCLKKIYALRSMYLHSGKLYCGGNYSRVRPILDLSTGTNCKDTEFISLMNDGESYIIFLNNIREWISYVLRKTYYDLEIL